MDEVPVNELGVPISGPAREEHVEEIQIPPVGGESEISPDVITSAEQLEEVFGKPAESGPVVDAVRHYLDPKNTLRVVVIGCTAEFIHHGGAYEFITEFQRGLSRKPLGLLSFPESDFEAGILVASADVLIFQMDAMDPITVSEYGRIARTYAPRTVLVALLEEGMPEGSIPESVGVHLEITQPYTPYGVAMKIDTLLFGPGE